MRDSPLRYFPVMDFESLRDLGNTVLVVEHDSRYEFSSGPE